MRGQRFFSAVIFAISLIFLSQSQSFAVDLRYTWMLPKTVIDATIAYTFEDCTDNKLKLKITPTLVARSVPDTIVGRVAVDTEALKSFWEDRNISIQTFAGSHILNSIGSSPTSQVGQVAGNILGGIAKLVGVALGVPVSVESLATNPPPASPPPAPQCGTSEGSAAAIATQIKALKTKIKGFQTDLLSGVDEATQKKDNAAIQAAQSLITNLQDQLTITIKTTIDPGVSPINVDADNDMAALQNPAKQSAIRNDGLLATICASQKQLDKAKWFTNLDQIFKDTRPHCAAIPYLEVNVYLDFPNGKGTMYDADHKGPYPQTAIEQGSLYRDVAYIPVLVWRGAKQTTTAPVDKDGSTNGPVQLIAPQTIPLGQFGVSQTLPLAADAFKTLTWQVTFLEDGEITAASFSSKASGVNATAFLGTAVSAANSIATEQRSAASSSNQAAALQGQADLIYQTQRLALCQANPTNCPSK